MKVYIGSLTKRKKIILVSLFITFVFGITHYFPLSLFIKILIGFVVTYFGAYFIFDFDLKGLEYFILPLIPILFYLSMVLSYPILERVKFSYISYPVLLVGMYILLLTFNILNIAIMKPLPLSKAAWVSFSLLRFFISFLVYTYLFWFHLDWYKLVLMVILFTIFLVYPGFYLLIRQLGRGERSLYYIITVTILIGEISFLLTFWRISFFGAGLITAALLYILTGIVEAQLKAQLTKGFFWEYGVVALFAGLLLFIL